MNEKTTGNPGEKLPTPSINVKVFPTPGKDNLLAFASVNLGGVFAVNGVRVMKSEKGPFVAMPSKKDARGEYRDICFPTTVDMRKALNAAVLQAYEKSIQKESIHDALQEAAKESKARSPGKEKPPQDRGAR